MAGLRGVECAASIAVRHVDPVIQRLIADVQVQCAVASLRVADGPQQNAADMVRGQRLQPEHAGTADQRANQRAKRVFRRRADERDRPGFDMRQQPLLLRAVPAVDFVDR
jgi:hypothetical protein